MLDIGCGKGWAWRFYVNPKRDRFIFTISVDIDKAALKDVKKKKLYTDVVLCDAHFLPFKPKSFDMVLILQLIEHLCKEDGLAVIKYAERISKKKLIIGTPNGYLKMDGHLSGWSSQEFEKLGYRVTGHGLRLYSENHQQRPLVMLSRASSLLPLTYKVPRLSYQLLAVKKKGKENI